MNKSKFDELINLYFDREISVAELECLKSELATNADRRREFQLRYRLHQATCSALSSEKMERSHEFASEAQTVNRSKYRPSLIFGFGMAACFLILFMVSVSVTRELTDSTDGFVAETSDASDEVFYVKNQESKLQFQESVSAELPFTELNPEGFSLGQQFSQVDAEDLQPKEVYFQDSSEPTYLYKADSLIPDSERVRLSEHPFEIVRDNDYWSPGFKSSLASFK